MAGIFDTGIFDTGIFDSQAGSSTLQPALLTNSQVFYAHTVAPGAVTLAPSVVGNSQEFFAPAVTSAGSSLYPLRIENSQAFFASTVAAGAAALQPSRLDSVQVFYSPIVSFGGGVLQPGLLSNAQSFYSPSVLVGAASIAPTLLQGSQEFFAPFVGPRSAGGGYDDEPKRKKRYVAKVGDRLVSFARKQDAIDAALRTESDEEKPTLPEQKAAAETPAVFPLQEIERLARERDALDVYKQRLQQMQYEALLRQYEDWQDEQDIDDILRLFRQGIEDILGQI